MTAHDLARQLLALPDLPVYLDGYEDGLTDVQVVRTIMVNRDTNIGPGRAGYLGEHEEVYRRGEVGVPGLYLPRHPDLRNAP